MFLISEIQKTLILQLMCERNKIIMIHSSPKNEVKIRDVMHASFKLTMSIVEIISTFRGILIVVYTQGHCWPQADFEDVSSGLCVWAYVSIPIGRLNVCSCLLLLTHFHLRLALLTNDK
jgi:hypothetical protein